MRDVARAHFSRFTGAPLDDPRAHVIIGDGRNHLAHARKTYDVVISQPSVPWFSGAAGMFTREGFADMRAALAPGGVAAIWYVSWTEETRDLLSLLRSWTDVFPNAYLFETRAERTFLLVGFADDAARLAADRVRAGLARAAGRRGDGELRVPGRRRRPRLRDPRPRGAPALRGARRRSTPTTRPTSSSRGPRAWSAATAPTSSAS